MLQEKVLQEKAKSISGEQKKYLITELKQRFQEVQRLLETIESDLRNGLITTGAFWSWLIINNKSVPEQDLKFLPYLGPLIILFFALRWFIVKEALDTNVSYIKYTEQNLLEFDDLETNDIKYTWEKYIELSREKNILNKIAFNIWNFFWLILLVTNIILACIYK